MAHAAAERDEPAAFERGLIDQDARPEAHETRRAVGLAHEDAAHDEHKRPGEYGQGR